MFGFLIGAAGAMLLAALAMLVGILMSIVW